MFIYDQLGIKLEQTILQNYPSQISINSQFKFLSNPTILNPLLNCNNIKNINSNPFFFVGNNIINAKDILFLNNEGYNIYYSYPILNPFETMNSINLKFLYNEAKINENTINLMSACSSKNSNKNRIEKIFDVIYPEQSIKTVCLNYIKDFDNQKNYKVRQRNKKKRQRRENQDNIRKKVKRIFLNDFVLNKINSLLKKEGSYLFFERFPHNFVSDIRRKTNNNIINYSIKEILEKKELYNDEAGKKYYFHNMKVLSILKEEKNIELNNILNMKFSELFNVYINSDEFKINSIKNLIKKNNSDSYIMRYIYISKHFIEFFSKI